ncbi:hypothetical protein niasHT_037914 [Heterodera trifolii]|uniref:Carboxylesterase type B domain-containing protein n=1 Tax=Heterodera trifolii TaxID=157864 RepID=A0ABD2HMW7_9BILA
MLFHETAQQQQEQGDENGNGIGGEGGGGGTFSCYTCNVQDGQEDTGPCQQRAVECPAASALMPSALFNSCSTLLHFTAADSRPATELLQQPTDAAGDGAARARVRKFCTSAGSAEMLAPFLTRLAENGGAGGICQPLDSWARLSADPLLPLIVEGTAGARLLPPFGKGKRRGGRSVSAPTGEEQGRAKAVAGPPAAPTSHSSSSILCVCTKSLCNEGDFEDILSRLPPVPMPSSLSLSLPFCLALLFLLLLSRSPCFSSSPPADNSPIVTTEFGPIRGQLLHVVDPVDGQPVALTAFLGVPFARPPLGELRFEKPLKPEKWSGVFNATEMAPACWPIARAEIYAEPDQLSEDCLYMNIFGPAKAGTSRQFKPEAIAKFVRRGLLFVTIQYRLAMLAMALQFLHDNLRRFGGDPSLLTLWGFSAGAASVGLLAASPHANGLFNGTALVEWSANDRVVGETKRLAKAVGCGDEAEDKATTEAVKECLRQKTPNELMDGIDKIGRGRNELNFLQFHPRFDGDFLPTDSAALLIQKAPPKRTIIGIASLEALTFTLFTYDPTLMSTQIPRAKWANFGRADLQHLIAQKIAPEKYFGDTAKMAQQRILQFYSSKKGEEENNKYWLTKYNEIITDTMFLVPMLLEAQQKMAAGWPIYLYQIEHINSGYPPEIPVKGSPHCVELAPLFGLPIPYETENATEADKHFQRALIETITSFTKAGVPRINSLANWRPTDRHAPFQYANFSSGTTQMEQALAPEKLEFWRQFRAEFPYDIIAGTKHKTGQTKDEL